MRRSRDLYLYEKMLQNEAFTSGNTTMSEDEHEPILVATIPGPLPPVPDYLIRRRPEDMELVEPKPFAEAVKSGDEGLIGIDGSGNDWEFSQQLGSVAVEVEFES